MRQTKRHTSRRGHDCAAGALIFQNPLPGIEKPRDDKRLGVSQRHVNRRELVGREGRPSLEERGSLAELRRLIDARAIPTPFRNMIWAQEIFSAGIYSTL